MDTGPGPGIESLITSSVNPNVGFFGYIDGVDFLQINEVAPLVGIETGINLGETLEKHGQRGGAE